jgi:hypothetical protein
MSSRSRPTDHALTALVLEPLAALGRTPESAPPRIVDSGLTPRLPQSPLHSWRPRGRDVGQEADARWVQAMGGCTPSITRRERLSSSSALSGNFERAGSREPTFRFPRFRLSSAALRGWGTCNPLGRRSSQDKVPKSGPQNPLLNGGFCDGGNQPSSRGERRFKRQRITNRSNAVAGSAKSPPQGQLQVWFPAFAGLT